MGGAWSGEGFYEDSAVIASASGQVITPGNFITLPIVPDMRSYESYYLYQDAQNTGAAAYCTIRANLIWDDIAETNTQFSRYREDYEWWAKTASPGANQEAVADGIMARHDRCQGGTLSATWFNNGTSNVTLDYALYGTRRIFDRAYQTQSPYDGMLAENGAVALPAGNVFYVIPMRHYWGNAYIHMSNATQPIQVSLLFGGNIYLLNGAGGLNLNQPLILSNKAYHLLLNRPAGAGTCSVFVTRLNDN